MPSIVPMCNTTPANEVEKTTSKEEAEPVFIYNLYLYYEQKNATTEA